MATLLSHKLTHVRDGLRRLLSKEKDATVIRGVLQAWLEQIQELEDTAWEVLERRTLAGAGAQLDAIGRFLNCPRGELSDSDYQIALRARIRMLRSGGRAPDLIDVATLSLPEGFTHLYEEAYPKTSLISVIGAVDFDVMVLWRNLLRTKPGGTKLYLTWDDVDDEDVWLFAEAEDETDDEDHSDNASEEADVEGEEATPGGVLSNVIGSGS